MKQGSVEQLVANELKCKWSATLAALAKLPLGVGVDLPSVPVSEAARSKEVLSPQQIATKGTQFVYCACGRVLSDNTGS